MSAKQVRIAFRRLLKVQRRRFEGDQSIVAAARDQTRKEFEANRDLSDPKLIAKRLKHARDVEEVIRRYVVQAPRSTEKDNTYQIKFTSEHALRDRHPILIKSSLQDKKPKDE
ncbi:Complex III assembly factor lyrm7 [Coemansia sp. RSA 2702]|nr:Complex III assembly factor lyrm7 [Coemansia sp. RSA 2705]KAJ2320287.1 Complex III assembly factor lyrm7 [Coemansia sp. RSA 2704]KAJ2329339.1 Complex III assembly factor lyrm7 [Coemansia sp. RSA 2702]